MTSLKKIDMCECEALEACAPRLGNLGMLEELNFSNCRSLKEIPEEFGGMRSVKKLDMQAREALEEFCPGRNKLRVLEEEC